MKLVKNLKIILVILIIVLISMISFGGIFDRNKGLFENKVPDYKLGKDLSGYRRVRLVTNDESVSISYDNDEEKLNEVRNNYLKTKSIIENRLNSMNAGNYDIRLNEENGDIVLELPENSNTDRVIGNVYIQGIFQIEDSETQEVLMTNADIDNVVSGYGTTNEGTAGVIINIQFNKEGTKKFEEITKTYIASEQEVTDENGETTTKNVEKKINLKLDDSTLLSTYFSRTISTGVMQLTLPIEDNATAEAIQEKIVEANSFSSVLDNGDLPIKYEVNQNKYIFSSLDMNTLNIGICIAIAVITVGLVYLVVKYKEKGIFGSVAIIGYIALLLLTLRYTNVYITVGGIATIIFTVILDYILIFSILKKENVMEAIKQITLMYIPILILSVVLTLTNVLIGAVLFWGIVIILLYNLVVANVLLK